MSSGHARRASKGDTPHGYGAHTGAMCHPRALLVSERSYSPANWSHRSWAAGGSTTYVTLVNSANPFNTLTVRDFPTEL